MPIKHFTNKEIEAWPLDYKGCKTCREVKPLSDFHRHTSALKGRATQCKACRHFKSVREYAEKSIEQLMCERAKSRAKDKEVSFNLTESDIMVPDVCPALGIKLSRSDGRPATDNSPSLDRIIPELGYVSGNVVVISYRANMIKSNASLEEILAVASWLGTIEAI